MRSGLKVVVLALFAGAATLGAVAQEHVGRNLERGEPQRWNEPADTPKKRFDLAMKEAKAALADALKECRATATGRKACEKEARDQYRLDVQAARDLLGR